LQQHTEIVADAARFEAMRGEWNRLLESSGSNGMFLTWEWLFTWWKHFSVGRKLSIVTARDGADLIAIAPLALAPPKLRNLSPFRPFEFLGSGKVGSDYLDVIVRCGKEELAIAALADELAGQNRTLNFEHLNRRACSAAMLADRLRGGGWNLSSIKSNVSPYIELAGQSWESYLAGLGAEHRYNVRRRLKNLSKRFEVRFEAARTEAERRDCFSDLVRLHGMRWEKNGGGVFQMPGMLAFHEEISRLALQRGWLKLFVLRLDGRPAAALYGFRYQRVFYFYQSGFDPEYGKFGVGLVTMALAIKSAIEEGAAEYDFLYGDEPYKFLWARRTRELGLLEIYPPTVTGRLFEHTAALNRAARKIAGQMVKEAVSGLR
jgi:CelD/BcsL family acetyltransferase involved in cellulose biosynthesis